MYDLKYDKNYFSNILRCLLNINVKIIYLNEKYVSNFVSI